MYVRFRRWVKRGVMKRLFQLLMPDLLDMSVIMVDGTFIKVHKHGTGSLKRNRPPSGEAIGRSRGGSTTKLMAATDRRGNLVRYLLLPGNAAESPGLVPLVDGIATNEVIADKAYDVSRIRRYLVAREIIPVIPSQSNRRVQYEVDPDKYRTRHLVENFFGWLKDYRGLATRYHKTDSSFAGMIDLAGVMIATR